MMMGAMVDLWADALDFGVVQWHLRATLALAAVLLAAVVLGRSRERPRHRLLAYGLLAAVALPTIVAWLPAQWGIALGSRPAIPPTGTLEVAADLPMLTANADAMGGTAQAVGTATPGLDFQSVVLLVWLAGAALCSAGVIAAVVGSWSLRRGAGVPSAGVRALFEAMQQEAGTAARLGVTPNVPGPIVVGARVPTVLLPRTALGWSEARLRAVFAHELGHVAQRDHVWFPVVHAVRALLWCNPLAWLAARAFFRAAEFSADEAAVTTGLKASRYAAQLLSLANLGIGARPATPLAAAALGRPDVGTRIRRLLRDRSTVVRMRRVVPVALGLLGAMTGIIVARPAAVAPAAPPVESGAVSPLVPIPGGVNRVSLRRGGVFAEVDGGRHVWAQDGTTQLERQGHLIVGLHDFLDRYGDDNAPLVVDADRSVTFAALVDVLYSAGRAGISSYVLAVPTADGERGLAISPPRFPAAEDQVRPALRVAMIVGEHAVRLRSRPSPATPPDYEDPQLDCLVAGPSGESLQRAAQRLCEVTDGAPVQITYTAPEGTSYGALTDTMLATATRCGGAPLIEAGASLPEPQGAATCHEVIAALDPA